MKNWLASAQSRLDSWGEKLKAKEFQYPVDLTAGVFCLVLSTVLILVMPTQYHAQPTEILDGGTFPKLMVYLMMACSACLVVKEVFRMVQKKPLAKKTINLLVEVRALIIFGIIFVAYLLCRFTGLFVIGAVFLAAAFLLYFRCKKPLYYVITISLAVAIWCAFRFGLGVRF